MRLAVFGQALSFGAGHPFAAGMGALVELPRKRSDCGQPSPKEPPSPLSFIV